jgi:hypothetical protein
MTVAIVAAPYVWERAGHWSFASARRENLEKLSFQRNNGNRGIWLGPRVSKTSDVFILILLILLFSKLRKTSPEG